MCSDGTKINVAAYNLAKEDLGEHYLLILCPAHKLELAIKDAFETSNFNEEVEKDLNNIYIYIYIYIYIFSYSQPAMTFDEAAGTIHGFPSP